MKFIKWKILIITCLVCLSSILLGLYLWDDLPDKVAIHFNIYNEADNFASKGFAVFGLPIMMVFLQMFCCIINDLNSHKHGKRIKLETATKWIIPIMTIILQIITFGYSLGWNIDIRKAVAIIIGVMFLVIGNYLPKLDYVKNYNLDTEKARKINRFIGYETVIMGVLMLITIFLPPIATAIWLVLLIPYTIISVIYGIKVGRKTD
ncbi:MAG: DUF1648 domain-containing protein [Clostridia bacterium]|nr:DUF1648 domain-containing protein [Clostridia bacterium]